MVDSLFARLAALPQVEAMALGGSRAGTQYDAGSDYDVYLYCTAPVPVEARRDILGSCCTVLELGNHYWEYEDNCTLNNGVDMDLLYRNLDSFTAEVAAVVEGGQARCGYTTCLWHNLRTCKILYDPAGRLAAARARFDVPYPEPLRRNILRRNRALLSGTLPAYDHQIAKAVARGDRVSVVHRTAAFLESYFDVLFALNRQTHPGEKRLVSLCRARCAVLPEAFEENLDALFDHLLTAPSAVCGDLSRIVAELDKVLEETE